LPSKNTTLRVFPPKALRPCGSIQTRVLKNGETAYMVIIPLDRKRHSRRVVRSVHTLEEAQTLLEHAQAAMMAPKMQAVYKAPPPIVDEHTRARVDGLLEATGSVVYYVRIPVSGQIKIGVTRNIKQRMNTFATLIDGCELLAVEAGGVAQERKTHAYFGQYRVPGTERFLPGCELLAHIDRLRHSQGAPEVPGTTSQGLA